MGFTIQLGTTSQPQNAIDKKFSKVQEYENCILKDESSIHNPVILVRTSESGAGSLSTDNYMYIPEFNRYYFIDDVISVRTNLCEIHGRVDVLYTYKDEILSNSGYVLRSATRSVVSRYLDDDQIKIYSNPYIVTKKFTGDTFANNPSFILAVSGGGSST